MPPHRRHPTPKPGTPAPYVGDPWDQQLWDTPLEYERFLRYMFMGPTRNLTMLVRDEGLSSYSNVWVTASKGRWNERAAAYDKMSRDLIRKQLEEGDLTARVAHVALAEMVLAKLTQRAATLHPDEIEVKDVAPLARTMVGISRQGRGMDTDRVTLDVNVAAQDLSPEEKRAALAAMAAEMARRAIGGGPE